MCKRFSHVTETAELLYCFAYMAGTRELKPVDRVIHVLPNLKDVLSFFFIISDGSDIFMVCHVSANEKIRLQKLLIISSVGSRTNSSS